jgi:hypothetical protein
MKTRISDSQKKSLLKPKKPPESGESSNSFTGITRLQHLAGNQAVQRLLAQRSPGGAAELNDDFEKRIQQERTSGQPLEAEMRREFEKTLGVDLSGVRIHATSEADHLNQHIHSSAFTTGEDIFFSSGTFDPDTSAGRQLLTHELTHVVQQGSGRVPGGANHMVLNNPGDTFEQEAGRAARAVVGASPSTSVQRQGWIEDEKLQAQEEDEDEPF